MQNIRFDQTSKTKQTTNWEKTTIESDAMTNHDVENAKRRAQWWLDQFNKPDLKDSERKELELMRRVSAVTQGDTVARRSAIARKEWEVSRDLQEQQAKQSNGQTEEGFREELTKWSGSYARKVEAARKRHGL